MDGQTEHSDLGGHYEFDAPTHVVDFIAPDQDDDNVDEWFEKINSASGHLTTPSRMVDGGAESGSSHPVQNTEAASVSNIVTTWGGTAPAQMAAQPKKKGPSAQPRRVLKRTSNNEGATNEPTAKKQRSSTSRQQPSRAAVRRSSGVRRSGSVRRSVGTRRSVRLALDPRAAAKARSVADKARSAAEKAHAAAANGGSQSHQMSSEQQEMERIRSLQKEMAEHRKKNEASYKAALAGSQPQRKAPMATTVPKEFNFSTDGRIKTSNAPGDTSYKEVDFTAQLRRRTTAAKAPSGTTVPKPFNLSIGNKRKGEEPAPYVSVAQQIEAFQKRTPDRYHLRSRQSQERGPASVATKQLSVTEPHTPRLLTRQRSRPTFIKSSAELEAEEVEKLQQFKFKAAELNRKILEAPVNPKKPAVKEPTKPEGFQLHMEKRVQERQANRKPEEAEEQHAFHACPVPARILEEVVGVPDKKVLQPTVPESPAFALKNRVRVERKVEEVPAAPAPVKALAVPHFALPFQPKLPEKSQSEVCPFSFDEREQQRRAMKEKRLEELRNEEAPKFKAQLLPDFHKVVLPEKKVTEPTKPEPFKLLIDERGAVKNDRWEQKLKEEQKRQAEAASFKARPNVVIHKEPFIPKMENRSVLEQSNSSVVPEGFQLSTERRAKERQEFERTLGEKEALRAAMAEEQRREQEQKEKENLARLRQEQVHKAQPIRHYKPVEVKKSDAVLTVPKSPNFSDRFHL